MAAGHDGAAGTTGVQTEPTPDTALAAVRPDLPEGAWRLFAIAGEVAPVLKELAEARWPRRAVIRKQRTFGFFGREHTYRETLPPFYKIILRRRDLGTLREDWRLEADGPVSFVDWDDSGRIEGMYSFRYEAYTVRPVSDEIGHFCGFGINCRALHEPGRGLLAIDARVDCANFVRSTETADVIVALRAQAGRPHLEQGKPGYAPTPEYVQVLHESNKDAYFRSHGANGYVGKGWTADSLAQAFADPTIRAVRLGI